MCGIAGIWRLNGGSADAVARVAGAMIDTLRHRGPDDRGVWVDEAAGLALANRRLAIVDLSPGGHQPMRSADGRVVIAFNGEIYNHPALRRDLEGEGVAFRSRSDTEVLVEAIARWGLDATLTKLNGMFALAVWDVAARRLTLVRDRLGEKPLYWSLSGGVLRFGSELKALRADIEFRPTLAPEAVAAFLRWSRIPAPATIYNGVEQLQPGHLVSIEADGRSHSRTYWSLPDIARRGLSAPLGGSADDQVAMVDALLADAVALRRLADVPVGVFLSGGIDSSLVTALMCAQGGAAVRTFSIGFPERSHDEAAAAAAVAAHLGTDHTALTVTADEAMAVIPQLPDVHDEPFADSSQIPTLLLSRLARDHVTVALSGDGGDECFAGYSRHVWADRIDALRRTVPGAARRAAAAALQAIPPTVWDQGPGRLPSAPRQLGDKVRKLAGGLTAMDPADLYASVTARWHDEPLVGPFERRPFGLPDGPDLMNRFRLADMGGYLPDGVLVKVDRASMAASMEVRVPFLDHRLVELAWRIPGRQLVRGGQGKWLLRRLLDRYVPRKLTDRPKAGFTVPLGAWLRGPLREWAETLLHSGALETAGVDPGPVAATWRAHLAGREDAAERLWCILSYVAWHQRWR